MTQGIDSNGNMTFGRYKGQSIETMLADRLYTGWLRRQGSLRRRYPDLDAELISRFSKK